jgi:hypothetical protein
LWNKFFSSKVWFIQIEFEIFHFERSVLQIKNLAPPLFTGEKKYWK